MESTSTKPVLGQIVQARDFYLNYTLKRIGSLADAEDIVQRAYSKAVRYVHTLRDEEAWRAWFMRIVRQCIADHYKDVQHQARIDQEATAQRALEEHETCAPSPQVQLCGCSQRIVQELPNETLELVRRVSLNDETPTEAAKTMGLSPNAARVRLHRVYAKIRTSLQDHCTIHGDGTQYRDYLECTCSTC